MNREKMITDLILLTHMRKNSRERLIRISKKHSKPLTEVMELYEELKPVILKHTSLINHKNFGKRYYIIIKVDTTTRNFILLKNFLKASTCTNNIYVYDEGLTVEAILPKNKWKDFLEELKKFDFYSIKHYEILDVLRQEDFHGKN